MSESGYYAPEFSKVPDGSENGSSTFLGDNKSLSIDELGKKSNVNFDYPSIDASKQFAKSDQNASQKLNGSNQVKADYILSQLDDANNFSFKPRVNIQNTHHQLSDTNNPPYQLIHNPNNQTPIPNTFPNQFGPQTPIPNTFPNQFSPQTPNLPNQFPSPQPYLPNPNPPFNIYDQDIPFTAMNQNLIGHQNNTGSNQDIPLVHNQAYGADQNYTDVPLVMQNNNGIGHVGGNEGMGGMGFDNGFNRPLFK